MQRGKRGDGRPSRGETRPRRGQKGGAERKAGGGPRALCSCLSERGTQAPRRKGVFASRRQEVGLEKENPPTVCGTTRSRCETDANQACYCTRWYDSGQRIIMVPQPEKRSEASVRVFPTRTTKL